MRRTLTITFLTALAATIYGTTSAQAQVMPKKLVEVAKSRSCEPLNDFFNSDDLLDPPYALGYLPGDRESSAVFFCRRGNEFFLMVAIFDDRLKFSCQTEIPYPGNPSGLRILGGKSVPLNLFRYVDPPHRYGPKTVKTRGPIIEDYYDGVLNWFYCHDGKWLRRFLH
jgi:hypothetical protein